MDSYYSYHPSNILPAIAAVVTTLSLCLHIYQNSHYKFWRVMFFMLYGGFVYSAGWIIRCDSVRHPDNVALFLTQYVLIYLAPPIYSAAEYNILSRVMHYVPMHAVIDPNRVAYIFISLSVIIEALTALGCSWIPEAQQNNDIHLYKQGMTCIFVAVLFQALVECGFILMVAIVHYRCFRAKMLPHNLTSTFLMLYGTSTLIIVRCIFRSIESAQSLDVVGYSASKNTFLLDHEWPLYVLDALPVILYSFWLNFKHPGKFLPKNPCQYLDFDGVAARMGPGWAHQVPLVLQLCDPFNIIGILSPVKRHQFYLRPEEWPEVERAFAQGVGKNAHGVRS